MLLHELLLAFAGMLDQPMGELPGFLLGRPADDLQAHAEADLLLAAVLRRHRADLGHVGADALVGVAPEEMDVGMLGRNLPGLLRPAAEIEFGIGLLQRIGPDLRALQLIELAVEMERPARGPQRLQDRDLLLHDLVALFLAPLDPFGRVLRLALAGDQVDADATARQLIEGRDHLGQQHRVDVARPRRHQHAHRLGARHHHGAGDPGLPAGGLDRHQHVFETGRFGGGDDLVEQRHRRRHLGARQPIGRGVAGGRQEPAELKSLFGSHLYSPSFPFDASGLGRTPERLSSLGLFLEHSKRLVRTEL